MSMRLRGASVADLEKLGIDTEGMTQGTKSIVQQYKAMAGIDIMEGTNYKSTFQILDELHSKWADLTDVERAAITEATGGKRGGSVMSSLMENWEDAKAVVEAASDSWGSAAKEQANYAESVQYVIDQNIASIQKLSRDFLSSDLLKTILNDANSLLKIVDSIVEKLGVGTIPALGGLALLFKGNMVREAFKEIGALIDKIKGLDFLGNATDLFSEIFGKSAEEIARTSDAIDDTTNAINTMTNSLDAAADTSKIADNLTDAAEAGADLADSAGDMTDIADNLTDIGKGATEVADDITDIADAATDTIDSIDDITDIADDLTDIGKGAIEVADSITDTADAVADVIDTVDDVTDIADELTDTGKEAENAANLVSKLGQALSGLSSTAIAGGVIVAAIVAIGVAAYETQKANEALRESAEKLGKEYSSSVKEIDNYKQEITGLQDKIKDSSTSYEEAKAARERLLQIQSELIDQYGYEASNINIVTEAINGQVDALDQLSVRKWQETKNDFVGQNLKGWDTMNRIMHDATDNIGVMRKEMEEAERQLSLGYLSPETMEAIKNIAGDQVTFDANSDYGTLTLKGSLEDVYQTLLDIQGVVDKDESPAVWNDLAQTINRTKDTLGQYKEFYDQYVQQEYILGDEYGLEDNYQAILDAYDQYTEAITSGDEKAKEAARNSAKEIFDEFNKEINSSDLTSGQKAGVRNFLNNLNSAFTNEFKLMDFDQLFSAESFTDEAQDIINTIQEFGNEQLLMADKGSAGYKKIEAFAKEYGLTVDSLIAKLRELDNLSNFGRTGNDAILNAFQKANNADYGTRRSEYQNRDQRAAMNQALNSLDNDYYNDSQNFNEAQWRKVEQHVQQIIKQQGIAKAGAEQYAQAIKEVADEARKAKGEIDDVADIKFDMKGFSSIGENIKSLKSLWDSFCQSVEEDGVKAHVDLTDVESLRDKFAGVVGEDNFDLFEGIVTNAESTKEQVSAAFTDMVTQFIDATLNMEGASQQTFGNIRTQLEEWGLAVPYIDQYVSALERKYAIDQLAATINSTAAASEEAKVQALMDEATQLGLTNEQLAEYIAAAAQAGYISFSGNLDFLDTLIAKLGSATAALQAYRAAFSEGGTAAAKNQGEYQRAKGLAEVKKKADEATKSQTKLNQAFTNTAAAGKKAGGGGSAAGKGAKDAANGANDATDAMSKLSGEIDDIQSAWKSLDSIMQDYAETGKITVDQAQEIANMDLRYLSMLNLETDALGVNEAGFESLIQAKIYEMQVTMMRNAIDLIGTFTDEAVAAEYLANSYLQMGDAALTAAGMVAQLQATVAGMAGSLGANGQAAAQMAMQGAINGITMLNNVDFSAKGAGVKGGGSEKEKGGAGDKEGAENGEGTSQEKEYEKDFDWIEKLLERLNKLTKQWTDQAERFFSYWNQNWAIDKAIKSGRDEITNTNKAISYYMTKAGEVELEPEYVKLVQKGGLSTETIEDEELGEKIEEYQEWWDKIIKCREALHDLYDAERDMIFQKLSNILDYYDKIQEYYDSLTSKFESFLSMKSASGQRTTMKDLIDQYAVGIESLEQLQQKYWSYQTGLTGFTERSSSEVIADLKRTLGSEALDITTELFGAKYGEFYQQLMEDSVDNTVSGIEAAQSEAYENLLKRRQELQDKLDTYNNAVEEKKRLKSEDLKLARGDKDETNRVKQLIKEQEAIIKAYKLTSADKKGIKELDKEIAGWESILFSSSFYDTAYQTIHDYQDRAAKYEELLAQKNDKAYWKSLTKAEQKEITQGLKENKLSSKEKKNQQYLQSRVDMIDQIGDTFTVSRLYAENYLKRQELENRKNLYDVALENLGYIYEDLSTEYRDAKIKELKQDLKDAKKEFKSNKWTTKDNDLLRWLESQQEALDQLRDNLIVDSDTSQSANYKELINQIGNIQSKTKVTNADQKKLAMYLDELNEINSGVLEEDIVRFRNQYEKWWNLNDTLEKKGSLSREQNLQKKKLEDSMSSMREKYQDHVKALQDELLDSLMVEDPKNKEDLTQNYERTKKALEESYEKQLTASQDAYKNTNRYREIYASWDTRNQEVEKYQKQIEAAQKQGKNTNNLKKKLDKAIKARDKLRDELDALALGATEENIGNYIEAWSYVRAHREAYENGTWKGSNADTYDKYRKQLDDWNKEKEDATKAIRQEMTDKLKELDTEYHKNLADMETEQHEKLEKMWELAKQIAEWEASSLQSTIDQLDMMIQRYQALANMLANTNFESLKKYDGVMDLFGLDKAKSEIELIREQYEKAITMSNKKIQSSIDMANVYKKLLDAAQENDEEDPNNFKSILSEYYEAESTTDEMRQTMDSIIEMLNSNEYTANDWVTEWNDKMQEAINSVIDAVDNIQTLKDELRENVIFKSINETIEQLDSLNSRLSSMANVIHDNWVIVGDTLTEYGLAKINLLGQQMQNSQKQVEQWAKKVKEIDRIVDEEDQIAAYGSTHQYLVARNEALENYYNALQSVESTAYEIYQLGKQADEARVNSLRNVAENYKSALDAKKSFYEYDKNIKSQTKDIEALKAQIEALNGVNTAEAKAQRAQLESQLKDAEDKLADTQTEHLFDLESQALEKFISDLEKTLNDANKSVKETFEEFAERLKFLLDSSASADVAKSLGNIFELLMGSDFTADLSGLTEKIIDSGKTEDSTSSSTTTEETVDIPEVQPEPSQKEVELIEDIEDAISDVALGVSEVSDKQDDQYVQMNKLDYLSSLNIQASKLTSATRNLANDTSNIYSTMQKDIAKQLSSIEKKLDNQSVNVSVRYDSLIRVNGAVDSMVVRDLERFANQVVNQTRATIINDLKSTGVYRSR